MILGRLSDWSKNNLIIDLRVGNVSARIARDIHWFTYGTCNVM